MLGDTAVPHESDDPTEAVTALAMQMAAGETTGTVVPVPVILLSVLEVKMRCSIDTSTGARGHCQWLCDKYDIRMGCTWKLVEVASSLGCKHDE